MEIDFKQILPATMILFAVVDIIGSIPLIISLRQKVGHIESEKASIVSAIIMIAFVFVGESILSVIGIDVYSFAVAGAFVIFALALEMVLGITLFKEDAPESAAVFPLAFPLIAGAGSLTSILSLKSQYATINIVIAIIINIVVVYLVLKSSEKIEKVLGNTGIQIIRKIFGVVLLAIAVKLFASNIPQLLNH
ncbi:MAG: multiple antibiotic resistance protein [Salibacteraceae bacterium]|jgi:multiple antibiotic resistance protein